ncbi:Holliday junction resolvase [Methanolacinia petrolearia DSM 11571]|uniref:Holliday junction resolvase n=1 Tax=Methanolacinia petrolearia (strain DSM 11571 / OCM 486 / SEBR 4847) TaxID=679926 RepID=E1RKJ5_METP4|nr:Holliday junction resolvase-like protein [Methanolacinia petrolearia]ADN35848.1 Holliday junction resolvase [Methanolacinia petrolearia DSM 11571]
MIEWALIFLLFIVILVLFYNYSKIKGQIEQQARVIFDSWSQKKSEDIDRWKTTELERLSSEKARIQFENWRLAEEQNIRTDAIKRSQSVTRGKVTECLIPFFPDFPYNPKDARFLGTPVDLIVFDGLSDEDEIQEVAFIEIKTGKTANLSKRERAVRDCIRGGRVQYYTIHQSFDESENLFVDMKVK